MVDRAIDGFVLAGGASTRMGVDKARAPWLGQPLALATALALRSICGRVALVRQRDDGLPWPLPDGSRAEVLVEPRHPHPHPLWGVAHALASARTSLVAVVPCDVPGIEPSSWRRLLAEAPAVASDGRHRHPLVAVLPASFAARAAALAEAMAPAHALTDDAAEVVLPPGELADRNRPEDLGPGPVLRLLERLPPHLPSEVVARIVAGERGRLLARGILDPDPGDALSSRSPEGA